MFPGSFMMGAKDRLLPPSIPYRFFVAAVFFHLLAWVLLLVGNEGVIGFVGGQGMTLAALHLITLGTLAMTAMGAAIQLLPVATRRPLGPIWAIKLMFILYAPGVALFAGGLAHSIPWAQHGGATLCVAGLALFGGLVGANLRKVDDLPGVTRHAWLAVASLIGLAVLGLVLVVDFTKGFLPDHASVAAAHAVLAGYGFMGMLALGFSYVLIPMFVLGSAVPDVVGKRTALLSGLGLALGAGGALTGQGLVAALGILLGLAACGVYLHGMRASLKSRMKKRLEPFFRVVWVAWALLPVSLLAGLAPALGAPLDPWASLWGFLLVFGWLLSFVTAILQRIMPFLASMHSSALGGKPALLSHLSPKLPVDIHLGCHAAALVLVCVALIGGWVWPLRLGLIAGLVGAVAFGVYTVEVLRRYRSHMAAAAAAHQQG
ncbi:hypothetical protein [Paramagnetospirillum magneticum]|uniref:Uncharacterized protein n=1 Tax=Paramagnetospirillum magneticum (strain ATCC 700264 / AMB-1) TaxID=342108 RepID=Q2W196_PARM1|nr:hypothetical protein [Paramagnetospirillum magneticum]BAE52379.1 hypothetical protein amb3575 [Paramagnetospirillum magneticum AMB-1]